MKDFFDGLRDLIVASIPSLGSIFRTGMNVENGAYPRVVISFDDEIVDNTNNEGHYAEFSIWMYSQQYNLDEIDAILYPIIECLDKKEIVMDNGASYPIEYVKGSLLDGFTEDKNEPFYRVSFLIPKIY